MTEKKQQIAELKDRLTALKSNLKKCGNLQTAVEYKKEIMALNTKIDSLEKSK